MPLSPRAVGDPHVAAHNEERSAINAINNSISPTSESGYFPAKNALAAGNLTILAIGDSKTEGQGVPKLADRWIERLVAKLREAYPIEGGDAGKGYTPAKYYRFYNPDNAPVITGSYTQNNPGSSTSYGLGLRSINMPAGTNVKFTRDYFTPGTVAVHYTRGPSMGDLEVLNGTTLITTISTAHTTKASVRTNVTVPAGATELNIRAKDGGAAVDFEGIFDTTSLTKGIRILDGSISGGNADMFAKDGGHWAVTKLYTPQLIIIALGANDMNTYDPATWAAKMNSVLAWSRLASPRAGVVILHGTEPIEHKETGRVKDYERALKNLVGNRARTTLLLESDLWTPQAGVDYLSADPDGWLADTVHTSALGHKHIFEKLVKPLLPAQAAPPATVDNRSAFIKSLDSIANAEAFRAATSTSSTNRGTLGGMVDLNTVVESGTYWANANSPALNYPHSPSGAGILVVDQANGPTYVSQTFIAPASNSVDTLVWVRTLRASVWSAWSLTGSVSGTGPPPAALLSPVIPIGTMYTDRSATAGARVWVKNTSTTFEVLNGNTGPQPLLSWDTGWTPDTNQTYVQRVGNEVKLFIGTTNTATGNVFVATLPVWARPSKDFAVPWAMGALLSIPGGGRLYGWGTTASGAARYFTTSWYTSQAWPTSL